MYRLGLFFIEFSWWYKDNSKQRYGKYGINTFFRYWVPVWVFNELTIFGYFVLYDDEEDDEEEQRSDALALKNTTRSGAKAVNDCKGYSSERL